MRHIATLVLAAMLVAGTLPAAGSVAAQHGTDAQYTTDLGDVEMVAGELGTDGAVTADADGSATATDADATTNHTGATVTGYEIADRTLAGDEPLRLHIDGSGEGSTAVVLSVDGEPHDLGTLTADGERASFEAATDGDIDFECKIGYDSEDGWYIYCEIDLSSLDVDDGSHDVGVNGLEPTSVAVGDQLEVTSFEAAHSENNSVRPTWYTIDVRGAGVGETPLTLSVDGERTRLGTVHIGADGARFVPDDDLDAQPIDVSIHCEGGYNSDDGWWLECEIEVDLSSAVDGGDGDDVNVAVNDLSATTIDLGFADGNLSVVDYDLRNRTINPNEPLDLIASGSGESSGETPLTLSVDGERTRLGTVSVTEAGATFEPDPDLDAQSIDVSVECEGGYNSEDGWWFECTIEVDLASVSGGDGSHDVGVNGLEPTAVAVGDDLEVTGYEFVDAVESANDTDAAVTVFRNNTVRNTTTTLAIRGTGVGETPLVLSVDGERTRLGMLSVTPDGASLEAAAATDPPSLHCEFGYDEDEGWYFRCELDLGVATLDGGGDHGTSVGVNDLEPTQVDVQPHEAQLASYEIRNDTVRTGGTVRMTTTFEGKTGEVPVVLTVDGQQFRAGTVTVEDGRVQSVQTADASAAPIGFVPCPDLQDDDPLVIVWCASDIPTVAQGSHDVGVNGVEPTEVTVESRNPGPFGPIDDLGDVLDLLLDGLFGG